MVLESPTPKEYLPQVPRIELGDKELLCEAMIERTVHTSKNIEYMELYR